MTARFKLAFALGALLCAPACKNDRDTSTTKTTTTTTTEARPGEVANQKVEQAQERAENALDRAQNAQAEAKDQQDDVRKAQNEVVDKEKDLREAQAKAAKESTEAQAAQAQANVTSAAATQEARTAQQQAVQGRAEADSELAKAVPARPAETTTAQNSAAGDEMQKVSGKEAAKTVDGRVSEARADAVVIERQGAEPLRVKVDSSTPVMSGGAKKTVGDLWAGNQVRVTYHLDGGQAVAEQIDVLPAAPSSTP